MSQAATILALGSLAFALILLLLYFREEAREIARDSTRKPLPGKIFLMVLMACTFLGMAVTDWQGACSLSPWGFVAGLVVGATAEIAATIRSEKNNRAEPV